MIEPLLKGVLKMSTKSEEPPLLIEKLGVNIAISLLTITLIGVYFALSLSEMIKAEGGLLKESPVLSEAVVIQSNSLLPLPGPLSFEEKTRITKKIEVVVTAYSSSPQETDDTPHLTASGTRVRDGIVATNILPLGTKVKFPELYGNKIFVVEDRMNSGAGYQADIWFSSRQQALNFGAKRTYIEIIQEG